MDHLHLLDALSSSLNCVHELITYEVLRLCLKLGQNRLPYYSSDHLLYFTRSLACIRNHICSNPGDVPNSLIENVSQVVETLFADAVGYIDSSTCEEDGIVHLTNVAKRYLLKLLSQ